MQPPKSKWKLGIVATLLIPAHRKYRGRWIFSLRPANSTYRGPGQPRMHSETLSKNKQTEGQTNKHNWVEPGYADQWYRTCLTGSPVHEHTPTLRHILHLCWASPTPLHLHPTLPINLLLNQPRHLLIHLGILAPRALYMPSKCVPPNYVPITLFYFETESYYISQAPA